MAAIRTPDAGAVVRAPILRERLIGDFAAGDDVTLERAVTGVPAGSAIVYAYFTVKDAPGDPDSAAMLRKRVSRVAAAAGQVTDDGSATGTGAVSVVLTPADSALLAGAARPYDLSVVLTGGATYTAERGRVRAQRAAINTAVGQRIASHPLRLASPEPDEFARPAWRNELVDDFAAGDDLVITRDVAGLPGGVTVASATLTARAAAGDPDPGAFQVAGAVTALGGGAARLAFPLARSQTLPLAVPHAFDVRVALSDGRTTTPVLGTLYAALGVTDAAGLAVPGAGQGFPVMPGSAAGFPTAVGASAGFPTRSDPDTLVLAP